MHLDYLRTTFILITVSVGRKGLRGAWVEPTVITQEVMTYEGTFRVAGEIIPSTFHSKLVILRQLSTPSVRVQ